MNYTYNGINKFLVVFIYILRIWESTLTEVCGFNETNVSYYMLFSSNIRKNAVFNSDICVC
jgi:hypothetical protein